ncbi:hypothetical protein NIES2107_71520 (plasmid) [Nostoc carneum NIES-2107]|nr:hypothetical protein NIES2107_71520 [Nostoc carneum NIES-2107]
MPCPLEYIDVSPRLFELVLDLFELNNNAPAPSNNFDVLQLCLTHPTSALICKLDLFAFYNNAPSLRILMCYGFA